MNRSLIAGLAMVVGLTALWAPGALAQSGSEESTLTAVQAQVEQDVKARGQQAHVDLLAKQYNLEKSQIEQLRAGNQGWGEVTIRLALADQVYHTKLDPNDPHAYTFQNALDEVGRLRAEGKGWGKIAKELGFKLGPVISEVQHVRNELRQEGRPDKASGRSELKGDNRQERTARVEHAERSQRPERPERPQRPERPDRPERAGK